MALPAGLNSPSLVSRSDVETLLSAVRAETRDPLAGIFGPGSVTWKINRESAVFLGAGRAALLQLAHPWVAAALAQHSTTLSNPIGRFHGTFRVIYTMLFGSLEQASAACRGLYSLHTRICGEMPESVAAYPAGSPYQANEISALRWVFATLVDSAVLAYNLALPALTQAEREAYYAESKRMASLFGIPAGELPADWDNFEAYNRRMWASDELGVSALSRSMAHRLLHGAGSWVKPPRWYRALTASWMPSRFRQEFQLDLSVRDTRAVLRAERWLPRVYPSMPLRVRCTGPWFEALERINGKAPGRRTRASNRFWMGQERLMYPELARSESGESSQ